MSWIASGRSRQSARPKMLEMRTIYEAENLSSPHKERDLKDCMLDSPVTLAGSSEIGSSTIPMPRLFNSSLLYALCSLFSLAESVISS